MSEESASTLDQGRKRRLGPLFDRPHPFVVALFADGLESAIAHIAADSLRRAVNVASVENVNCVLMFERVILDELPRPL